MANPTSRSTLKEFPRNFFYENDDLIKKNTELEKQRISTWL